MIYFSIYMSIYIYFRLFYTNINIFITFTVAFYGKKLQYLSVECNTLIISHQICKIFDL